jgi:chemotaxis protein CheD
MENVVGLGGCIISNNQDDVIKTFALSTCVGITVYCPVKKILAMAHIVLPDSTNFKLDADFNRMKFADTAINDIFQRLGYKYGCTDKEKVRVKIFGGISFGEKDSFHIGERNLFVVRNELNNLNICFDDSETGGNVCRTLIAKVSNGNVDVIKNKMKDYRR